MKVGTSDAKINGNGIKRDGGEQSLTIYGQTAQTGTLSVYVSGDYWNAIGPRNLTINGGNVIANAEGMGANGLKANGGGTISATGGSGINCNGTITLGWNKPTDRISITASSYNGTVSVASGQKLTDGTNIYSGTLTDDQVSALAGKPLQPCLALADNADNTAAIRDHKGQALAVALQGRTLYKDGDWNTLCLPFDVSTTSGPLAGDNVVAMTLNTSESNLTGSTLTLNFDEAETIPAGTPFIIKWATKDAPAANLENPVFTGVTIDNSSAAIARKTVTFTGGNFKGTYRRNAWNVENKSILLLGTNNTLYWPKPADEQHLAIGACRAYFDLGTYEAREFVLNFGEENIATSI